MITLIIDGRRCKTKEQTHAYLARKPMFPAYYGKNLDALFDVLTSCMTPIKMIIRYPDSITANLGDYGEKLLQVFAQAAQANDNITLEMK